MSSDRPADLDDLFLSCRAQNAKRAFGEAVACFRAGAYRACIVATWTAVVFDYLSKLRELELAGIGAAAEILAEFENVRKAGPEAAVRAQKLEAQVLSVAADEKFALLTPIEMEDLERLRLDRHRCAHPSLLSLDEPYQPPAELARLHMRNAVTHLLSRPPVQGQEAWNRIWAAVSSEYFPEEHEAAQAAERIRHLLDRARPTLIRRLLIELTQRLLGPCDEMEESRARAALRATIELHHQEAEKLFQEKLDTLANGVRDEDLKHLISYCRHVGLAWSALGAAMRSKLERYVKRDRISIAVLADAYTIADLRQTVLGQVPRMAEERLVWLAEQTQGAEILDEIVTRFESIRSFPAYQQFRALRPALQDRALLKSWTLDHRKRLVRALDENPTLREYDGNPGVAKEVLELCRDARDTRDGWRTLFERYAGNKRTLDLAREIRAVFPEFPDVPEGEASASAGEPREPPTADAPKVIPSRPRS